MIFLYRVTQTISAHDSTKNSRSRASSSAAHGTGNICPNTLLSGRPAIRTGCGPAAAEDGRCRAAAPCVCVCARASA